MTKVGRIIYEEKIAYGKEIEERVTKEVTKEVTQNVTEQQIKKAIEGFVKLCKKTGGSITDVVEQVVANYGFSEEIAREKVEQYW